MDITGIPMACGFVYLTEVADWFSRRVRAWRVFITRESEFCVEALNETLARHGQPEIFNTDQGSRSKAAAPPACCWNTTSPSAWTAVAPGVTRTSLSGCSDR
jgi:transposase InsO family protein